MKFLYVSLTDEKYKYWDNSFECWIKIEAEATHFTLEERSEIERNGSLRGGFFVKARV